MNLTLEALGFTKEELQQRVVDQLCEQLLSGTGYDEDGVSVSMSNDLEKRLKAMVAQQINASVEKMAAQHVLPKVSDYVENLTLQSTNQWGEKTGKAVTFIEFLVARADAYMREPVDFFGKTKAEESYNWRQYTTRIAYMIDKHIQGNIEKAMNEAMTNANRSIALGLHEAVRVAINEVTGKLKVQVQTK